MKVFKSSILIWCFLCFGSISQAIVGGSLASIDDAVSKSTVALVGEGGTFCSGTLITDFHIVTAAHCLGGSNELAIGFGISPQNMTLRRVARIKVHELYDPEAMVNFPDQAPHDIALITLAESAPAEATPVEIFLGSLNNGDPLLLAGFGATGFRNRDSGLLRSVTTVFQRELEKSLEFTFGPTPGKSACRGDSGGPAYTFGANGELLLLGATSRGLQGKRDSQGRATGCVGEGFYTRVSQFVDWLNANLLLESNQ